MIKKLTAVIALGSFMVAVSGCANNEHMTDYYAVEQARTDAIIASINTQTADRGVRQVAMMSTYSSAISSAASTPSASDDVAIALAWGYLMGKPDNVEIPRFAPVKAPPTNVDYLKAWTPMVALAMPFLYGWGFSRNNDSGDATSYSADNGGSIIMGSGNPGSYNTVGAGYNLDVTQSDYALVNNISSCPGADCDLGGGIDTDGGIDTLPEGVDQCIESPPGGYSDAGKPMYNDTYSCTTWYGNH